MTSDRPLSERLDQRVTLQDAPAVGDLQNAHNEPTGAWIDVATVWAEVLTEAGAMALVGDQLKPTQSFAVTIRRREVDVTQRLTWTDRNQVGWYLYIQAIGFPKGPRGEEMLLTCTAGER